MISHTNVIYVKKYKYLPWLGTKEFIQWENLILMRYLKILFTKLILKKNGWGKE